MSLVLQWYTQQPGCSITNLFMDTSSQQAKYDVTTVHSTTILLYYPRQTEYEDRIAVFSWVHLTTLT